MNTILLTILRKTKLANHCQKTWSYDREDSSRWCNWVCVSGNFSFQISPTCSPPLEEKLTDKRRCSDKDHSWQVWYLYVDFWSCEERRSLPRSVVDGIFSSKWARTVYVAGPTVSEVPQSCSRTSMKMISLAILRKKNSRPRETRGTIYSATAPMQLYTLYDKRIFHAGNRHL